MIGHVEVVCSTGGMNLMGEVSKILQVLVEVTMYSRKSLKPGIYDME